MWISKDADVRKEELLKTAIELFYEKGQEKTTINDIITKVGVTKGAFYYYFKSMDDVVETIALREAEQLIEVAKKYAMDEQLNGLEKLKGLMREAISYNRENIEDRRKFYKLMMDENNAKLAQKIQKIVYGVSYPLIKGIIEQGNKEGLFNTEYIEEAAELYIHLSSIYKGSIFRLLLETDTTEVMAVINRKLTFYCEILESALGVNKSTLAL